MSQQLTPVEIFDRSAEEGRRRLDQGNLELVATGFIAGFTIVFGLIAMAVVEGLTEPAAGEASDLFGALAFGVGVVFLVIGRTELFNENFLDPIATAFTSDEEGIGEPPAFSRG
ncbi:formate/nitrite transporter family protein [Tranquillimonas alkanivorans]|uniref:Formate/nitrite transporter n=1 Tax=Tranquillimonas alkanivorans TaxID=441119 RepID=A0A1I5WZX0_9RHOB|nr:formate/nitrite transporter family protein [Tranquillimonas alkanivorans]SFQ25259.1 Formate/nitrite transporter [Tranquillimonas alkanivorans]